MKSRCLEAIQELALQSIAICISNHLGLDEFSSLVASVVIALVYDLVVEQMKDLKKDQVQQDSIGEKRQD